MEHADKSFILFHNPNFGLDDAYKILSERSLEITREDDVLLVQWYGGPLLRVRLARGADVQNEATHLGKGTLYASSLDTVDAQFEITFDNLDDVLYDINTLIAVQATLQDATNGFLYNTWNQKLSPPDT